MLEERVCITKTHPQEASPLARQAQLSGAILSLCHHGQEWNPVLPGTVWSDTKPSKATLRSLRSRSPLQSRGGERGVFYQQESKVGPSAIYQSMSSMKLSLSSLCLETPLPWRTGVSSPFTSGVMWQLFTLLLFTRHPSQLSVHMMNIDLTPSFHRN